MRLENFQDTRLRGAIWPTTESINRMLEILGAENEHTLVLLEGEPPAFIANLFGDHGALISLEGQASTVLPYDGGTALRIELPSRKLTRFSGADLIAHRAQRRERPE